MGHRPDLPTALLLPSCPQEASCAYSIIIMALFWCTEALPLAVTALFPIFLYPLMGIMDASEVSFLGWRGSGMEESLITGRAHRRGVLASVWQVREH